MSLKTQILNKVRVEHYGGKEFVAGGTLERYFADVSSYKPSNVSRRLRELAQEGHLESREVSKTIEGKTHRYVEYKIKT